MTATAQRDPLIGQVLDGRYRVDRQIGRGGMGAVYRATQIAVGREVAVKVIRTDRFADAGVQRFEREARVHARLAHTNIVHFVDFGRCGEDRIFIVMELVDGRCLRRLINEGAPFEHDRALHLAEQLLMALAAAHGQGVVHRDLKPDNVLVTVGPDGREIAKVADFGLASHFAEASLTAAGDVVGSPRYMSPEQATAQPITTLSDIYTFGAVLYEMLTGTYANPGTSALAIIRRHLNLEPMPERPEEPAGWLMDIALSCLRRDPRERPRSAVDLLKQLRASAAGDVRPPHPVKAPEPAQVLVEALPVPPKPPPVPPRAAPANDMLAVNAPISEPPQRTVRLGPPTIPGRQAQRPLTHRPLIARSGEAGPPARSRPVASRPTVSRPLTNRQIGTHPEFAAQPSVPRSRPSTASRARATAERRNRPRAPLPVLELLATAIVLALVWIAVDWVDNRDVPAPAELVEGVPIVEDPGAPTAAASRASETLARAHAQLGIEIAPPPLHRVHLITTPPRAKVMDEDGVTREAPLDVSWSPGEDPPALLISAEGFADHILVLSEPAYRGVDVRVVLERAPPE